MRRYPSSVCLVAGVALATSACATVQYRTDFDREADFVRLETYGWMLPTEEEQQELARISPFLERRLTRALDRELTDRGYVETTDGNPDFWVSAYPVVPIDDEADDGSVDSVQRPVRTSSVAVSVGVAGGGFCCRGFYGLPYPYGGFGYPYGGFGYPYGGFGYPRSGWYPGFGVGFYSVGGRGGYPYGGYGYPISASASGYAPGTLAIDVTDGRSDELVWRGWAEGALFEPVSPERLAGFIDEVVEKIMRDFPLVPEAQ